MDKKFIINLQGKDFVLFEGLLNEFHKNGGKEILTEETASSTFETPSFKATVKGEKGTYTGHGDANNTNVNSMVAKHKYRMAETRAIARALRWYNNIGMCSSDELGGDIKEIVYEKPVDTAKAFNNIIGNEPPPLEVANVPVKEAVAKLNGYAKPKAGDKCSKCGAEMVLSPKTQKVFCSAKCWLNK